MPQDIVVGQDAEKVADFVAKYSGDQIPNNVPEPSSPAPAGESDSSSSPSS
jgi:hypothetical protein